MKLELLKPIDFRTDKFKKGDVVDIPEGLAQRLILNGIATKASNAKAEPKKKKGK